MLRASSGIEGIVAKRADSLYRPGIRSPEWIKIKSWRDQSCVIAGYTAGRGRRTNQLGALILAVLDGTRLVHCGQVGTGFDEKTLRDLRERLTALKVDKCALDVTPKTSEPATWVKPELVCEVRYASWTRDNILRHPAYLKLRPDQTVADCTRETGAPRAPLPADATPSRDVSKGKRQAVEKRTTSNRRHAAVQRPPAETRRGCERPKPNARCNERSQHR